jgi:transcriptional regulator of acetoin/glycerol metabolism
MSYDWPGNIKQLQGVVEQAFFNTTGGSIGAEDINLLGETGIGSMWKEDKEVFVDAWKVAGGNISRLANMLDVSRVTLYRYLKKFGLDKD